ncbi:hypothetical protein ACOCG7_05900 [Paraburkholderia sp. DD10]|uniref:hypothetical protein n=1 Tax=Paraburkholderia sp. DD10 TaxID=3409691 RepID=UPI003BA316C1
MTYLSNLDDQARAELLCYLVVGQLVARARTSGWMRTDHVVELLSIWLNGNGARADWTDCVHLGALSEKVALGFAEFPMFADSYFLAQLFTDGWRLDYPLTKCSQDLCSLRRRVAAELGLFSRSRTASTNPTKSDRMDAIRGSGGDSVLTLGISKN